MSREIREIVDKIKELDANDKYRAEFTSALLEKLYVTDHKKQQFKRQFRNALYFIHYSFVLKAQHRIDSDKRKLGNGIQSQRQFVLSTTHTASYGEK